MNGNMVNGITLCVSFARRQNQCGDSGHFRSTKSVDKNNNGDKSDCSKHSRGERCGRFKGTERIRFRGRKGGRRRSRGHTCESGEPSLLSTSAETSDNFRSDVNEASGVESTMQSSRYKNDFWSAGRQSPERMSGPSVEENDKEEDRFDTYKSTISGSEGDDLNVVNKKDGDFNTYKLFNNDGGSSNYEDNFGKRRGSFEHRGGEGRRSSRCRSFRGGERSSRMPRRGSRNRRGSLWRSRRRSSELGDIDYCSTDNMDISRKSSCPTRDKSGDKDNFRTSDDCHASERTASDVANQESESLEKGKDGKDDLWHGSSRSSNGDDGPWSTRRSGGNESFRGSTRGDCRSERKSEDRGGRRRQHDIDNNSTSDEEGVSSCYKERPDVDSKRSPESNSPPPRPLMSEVQVAWSEASKFLLLLL